MSGYVKQGDAIVLLLTVAEANALCLFIDCLEIDQNTNNPHIKALNRSVEAIRKACNPSSRTGARIE